MYNDDLLRNPTNEIQLWGLLREHFEYICHILTELPVESEIEALYNVHHTNTDGTVFRDGMNTIRFRNTGSYLDQREYYLELGRALLPEIKLALIKEETTPQFVQQWGELMFCHGYVASYVFDDTDDLQPARAGKKSGEARLSDAQLKVQWVACMMLPLLDQGMRRYDAELKVVDHIKLAINNPTCRGGLNQAWFEKILCTKSGVLRDKYHEKKLSIKRMRRLASQSLHDIPPLQK